MKARARRLTKRLLIEPGLLLLSTIILAALLCLASVYRGSILHHGIIPRSYFDEIPQDARAFLFFEKANINEMDLEGLVLIPGIGEITAQKILDYRDDLGFILALEELLWPQGPVDSSVMAALMAYVEV